MRMRRKPWARPELDASRIYIKNPARYRGRRQEMFYREGRLRVELGCGKGLFLAAAGPVHPEKNFLGFDIKSEVLASANRNILASFDRAGIPGCPNVRITAFDIEDIDRVLAPEDRVEEIYINFCNPWPKSKHRKHRLTHPRQLVKYRSFLRDGGRVFFKTDDDGLFSDSLRYFESCGFGLEFVSRDMAKNGFDENFATEYEIKFTRRGVKIKGLKAVKLPRDEEALKARAFHIW